MTLEIRRTAGQVGLWRTDGSSTLPEQPHVQLQSPALQVYLRDSYRTAELDKLMPYLWLVSTPRSSHVCALHHQAVRGRNVVVAENPRLHLVWYHDRIFVKPIPPYLLSQPFWTYLKQTDMETWRAAAGFMRTYSYLIRYEVDFRKATESELRLIPPDNGKDPITFERFVEFIAPFASLDDGSVSPRYQYGELRLTRLNKLTMIFTGKLTYHHIHAQWSSFFESLLAPSIAILAPVSVMSGAMQVVLAATGSNQNSGGWLVYSQVSRWISVIITLLAFALLFTTLSVMFFMVFHDIWFARRVLRAKRNSQSYSFDELKSGVISA
ncbi:MAG: hypothetical protein M1821_007535 [Bathelium mastoideum]|nr:MAG: hypothetical protein M1821_007535 [Bathelium mastoideum]KAI9695038.1 MAG: hypothetical protein M1822_000655 [Bathelium mastoideum]